MQKAISATYMCRLVDLEYTGSLPASSERFPLATQFNTPQNRVSFGEFEYDCGSREFKRDGQTVRLEPQPAKVLSVVR